MDGASGGGKTVGDPEGLLRSALEKIVFFECRVSQLESELAAARGVAERARAEAAEAQRREVELDQAAAGERGARAGAERRNTDLEERVRLLEAERERLLAGLVDRARVAGAPDIPGETAPEEGGADLAGFIAELRAEIESLRAFKSTAEAAGFDGEGSSDTAKVSRKKQPARSVTDVAARFEDAGRVGLTVRDAERMKDLLATRADRALYERSMDDLAAADDGRRLRAVRALEALGSKASAPLLAAALGREPDAQVKAALLSALASFGEPFAADLAAREMADTRPAVRVAALDALAAVAKGGAEERLAGALEDESPLVRRRAALLLGFTPGDQAENALAAALSDPDRGVARAAAAALSGRPSAKAQGALARGLEHPDGSVRRAAASALTRLAGETLDADAPASARRAASRRIAERLAAMDGEELRAAVLRSADAPAVSGSPPAPPRSALVVTLYARSGRTTKNVHPVTRAARPVAPRMSPLPRTGAGEGQGEGATVHAPSACTAVAVVEAPAGGLEPDIIAELRAALRGCTADALAAAVGAPRESIDSALQGLAAAGRVALRGTRWFTS